MHAGKTASLPLRNAQANEEKVILARGLFQALEEELSPHRPLSSVAVLGTSLQRTEVVGS